MAGRFSIEAVFKAVDRVTAPVSRMQNRVRKFTRSMTRGLTKADRMARKMARGIKTAALAGVVAIGLLGGATAALAKSGIDFEQAITNVGAVTLQTREQIESLEKLALKLGRTTKFTATQSAQAMEVMARAGFNTNEILSATPAVLSAAAASGLEIAEVANHVSNALKGMGLEVTEAANVADMLALASSKTNSSIGSLGESIRNVASTARQLNIPITEVIASVALLQDVGLDASVAGSAFNTMLTKMAAPTASITKQMKKFGITFKDSKGNMLPFQKVLEQLSIASEKAGGNFDQVAFLAELVGLRGQKAASNLADLFKKGKVGDLVELLENAGGSAERMANIRMNTVQGSLLLLTSAIDGVKVAAFDLQSGPLKDIIDRMTKWISLNEKLLASRLSDFFESLLTGAKSIADNFETIVTWMKRIGIGLIVFFTLMTALKSLVLIMTVVNLVMMANPITLIVIGIVALIAAVVAVVAWWEKWNTLTRILIATIAVLLGPIGILMLAGALLIKYWEPVKTFFIDMWDAIVLAFTDRIETIMNTIKKVKGFVTGLSSKVTSGVSGFFGFGDDEEETGQATRQQVISPQDRIAKSIDEQRTTSTAEVTIKDDTGRAEVTGGKLGTGLKLQATGSF